MNATSHSTKTMPVRSPREYSDVKAKVNSNCHASKSPVVRIKKIAENVLKQPRKRSDLDGPEEPEQLLAELHPKPAHPSLQDKCSNRRTREMRGAVASAEERLLLITKMETCRGKVLLLQKDLTHRLINEVIGVLKPKKIAVKAVTALYLLLHATQTDRSEEPAELQWDELRDYFTYKKRLLHEITDVKRRIETETVDLHEFTLLKTRFFQDDE